MRFKEVKFKFPGTRKEREMVVCPKPSNRAADDNRIMIQGDDVLAEFDPATGKGRYNIVKCHPGFIVLAKGFPGIKEITFPMDFVKECVENEPQKGDVIGGVLIIG